MDEHPRANTTIKRIQGRYALITACIGGGQGIATMQEREQ